MVQSVVMESLYRFEPYFLKVRKDPTNGIYCDINISQRKDLSVIAFESDTICSIYSFWTEMLPCLWDVKLVPVYATLEWKCYVKGNEPLIFPVFLKHLKG